MLSCDTPNGQAPSSTDISTATQTLPAASKAAQLSLPLDSSGLKSNGTMSTETSDLNGHRTPMEQHIWLVTGPAGCGKTTIAQHIANSLSLPYIEGDEVSPLSPPYTFYIELCNFFLLRFLRGKLEARDHACYKSQI